jgi:uncharacterized membrane protein YphA (DoxX/SURF4 family)
MKPNLRSILTWALKIVAAAIMLKTLYFKFTGHEESVYIFSTLGMEPWGRIGTGIGELIASILLFIPRGTIYGALMGMGLMGGAMFFHVTKLGIDVKGDGGGLFISAAIVWIACAILTYIYKKFIPFLQLK